MVPMVPQVTHKVTKNSEHRRRRRRAHGRGRNHGRVDENNGNPQNPKHMGTPTARKPPSHWRRVGRAQHPHRRLASHETKSAAFSGISPKGRTEGHVRDFLFFFLKFMRAHHSRKPSSDKWRITCSGNRKFLTAKVQQATAQHPVAQPAQYQHGATQGQGQGHERQRQR